MINTRAFFSLQSGDGSNFESHTPSRNYVKAIHRNLDNLTTLIQLLLLAYFVPAPSRFQSSTFDSLTRNHSISLHIATKYGKDSFVILRKRFPGLLDSYPGSHCPFGGREAREDKRSAQRSYLTLYIYARDV